MKPFRFSWIVFGVVLVFIVLLGSFSGVNSDGIPDFWPSVVHGWQQHDIALMIAAVLTAVLLAWLLLVFITRLFRRTSSPAQ